MKTAHAFAIVAVLGLTVVLSALPGGRAAVRPRRSRPSADAAFARLLSLAEEGSTARSLDEAMRVRTLDFGLEALRLDDPTEPVDPTGPTPTTAGTNPSTASTTGTVPIDPTGPEDPVDPWPWPWPWPPFDPWPPYDPWPPFDPGTTGTTATDGSTTGSNPGTDGSTAGTDGSTTGGNPPVTSSGTDGGTPLPTTAGASSGSDGGDTGSTGGDTDGSTNGGLTGGVTTTGSTDGGTTGGGTTSGGGGGTELPPGTGAGPWWLYLDKPSLLDGKNVSGTNVRMTPRLNVNWDAVHYAAHEYPRVYVWKFVLQFVENKSTEYVDLPVNKWFDEPADGRTTWQTACSGATFQFASTHFAPGRIPVAISPVIFAYNSVGLPLPFPLTSYTQPSPMAYNVGLTLSTNFESRDPGSGQRSHIFVEDPASPYYDGAYQQVGDPAYTYNAPTAWRICADAKQALVTMHHRMVTQGDRLTRQTLLPNLATATTFFSCTHGDGNGIDAYASSQTSALADFLTFDDDISKAVERSSDVPKMNLVILHSCGTIPELLSTGPGETTKAYRAFFGQAALPDTAYVGFSFPVSTTLINGAGELDQHAAELYYLLYQGYTVEEALDLANRTAQPQGTDSRGRTFSQNMVWSGDGHARLMSVYTQASTPNFTAGQPLPSASTLWYKVLKP